jgi:regulator of sigma E protease
VAVDGRRLTSESYRQQTDSVGQAIGAHKGTPVALTVERGGQEMTIRAPTKYDDARKRWRFGITYDTEASAVPAGPIRASGLAVEEMWRVTSSTVSHIAQIFIPEKREQIGSVVGGYETTRQAIQVDATTALVILAFISLSLGVINLFPFLPLDGGHIFWALAEKVRGRAIPFSVMERAGFVGFALVIMLFVIGLTNDLERIANGGFRLR